MDRPNIVLMMTDQQHWDSLRFLGFEPMVTPNLAGYDEAWIPDPMGIPGELDTKPHRHP